jgi:hypothetical protein
MSFFSKLLDLFRKKHAKKKKYLGRVSGRREILVSALLTRNYLSHYEISIRTNIPPDDVSKLMSAAFFAGLAVERVKKTILIPSVFKEKRKRSNVWCYRLKTTEQSAAMPDHQTEDRLFD